MTCPLPRPRQSVEGQRTGHLPTAGDIDPDAVPTRTNVGDWTFSPGTGGTKVRYRICTDAGGNVPRWAGEMAARNTLPGNVADIVREVRRRSR